MVLKQNLHVSVQNILERLLLLSMFSSKKQANGGAIAVFGSRVDVISNHRPRYP